MNGTIKTPTIILGLAVVTSLAACVQQHGCTVMTGSAEQEPHTQFDSTRGLLCPMRLATR